MRFQGLFSETTLAETSLRDVGSSFSANIGGICEIAGPGLYRGLKAGFVRQDNLLGVPELPLRKA